MFSSTEMVITTPEFVEMVTDDINVEHMWCSTSLGI